MANVTMLNSNRLQPSLRPAGHRAVHRHAFVRASKDAQMQEMLEFKQNLAKQLEQTATARGSPVKAAETAVAEGEAVAGLREIDSDTYQSTLDAAGDKLLVVDFFTAWCGPCKIIYPLLCEMAKEYEPAGVQIVKFECNKKNKELGMKLAIKVAPTFHLYKNGAKVAEMTGAKVDVLRELIEKHK